MALGPGVLTILFDGWCLGRLTVTHRGREWREGALAFGPEYAAHVRAFYDDRDWAQDYFGWFTLGAQCSRCGRVDKVADFECA